MNTFAQPATISKGALWTGRVISWLLSVLLMLDCVTKILKLPQVVSATVQAGYPASTTDKIGYSLLLGVILYLIPRTSHLGAILITAYLGGAVATNVRLGNPVWQICLPIVMGALIWFGLYLRDGRLRTLVPIRS
jgi:DoxX-like family